jgi:hypothetical protein
MSQPSRLLSPTFKSRRVFHYNSSMPHIEIVSSKGNRRRLRRFRFHFLQEGLELLGLALEVNLDSCFRVHYPTF